MSKEFVAKICLCGDGAVGKTALVDRFVTGFYKEKYMMTIGADMKVKSFSHENQKIKLQIWDLAGQDRFDAVRGVYFIGSLGIMLLFDVTKPQSFNNLGIWIKKGWKCVGKPVPILLVGNKIDSTDPPRIVSWEETQDYVNKIKEKLLEKYNFGIEYIETSAKSGKNVTEAFERITSLILQKRG